MEVSTKYEPTYLRREGPKGLSEQGPAEVGQQGGTRPHGEDAGL